MKDKKTQNEANRIARDADRGKINPLEAGVAVSALLGGLTRAIWNPGHNQFKIYNDALGRDVRIRIDGLDYKTVEEMAALCYHLAEINGSRLPGEVHLGDGISSKHHAPAFKEYVENLLEKYGQGAGVA